MEQVLFTPNNMKVFFVCSSVLIAIERHSPSVRCAAARRTARRSASVRTGPVIRWSAYTALAIKAPSCSL